MGEEGPTGRVPKAIRRLGNHPDKVRSVPVSFFDNPPKPSEESTYVAPKSEQVPVIRNGGEYFKGRDLPTDVWAPSGIVYYKKIEDIPTLDIPNKDENSKAASWDSIEERAATALEVCPPAEGEFYDASFKFVGERGLYVRVILGKTEKMVNGEAIKEPIIRWMHFNEEGADFKDIRYR